MEAHQNLIPNRNRGEWVRLRTLVMVRWVAIVGQVAAITVAQHVYGVQFDQFLCYLTIGVAVAGNVVAVILFPQNKRLTELHNFLMIIFDLLQLGALLFVTGGLNNPFAMLLLGPVTISASALRRRSFYIMSATALIIVSLLSGFHLHLRTATGEIIQVPDILIFGQWVAIVIAVLFLGAYSRRVSTEMNAMSDALFATQMALDREQKLTDLGGMVAAAAHELGTPLATIKLASSELIEELDDAALKEDAALISDQTDRCRDILRSMGQAGKTDPHWRQAPLSAVIQEAAEPHENRGKQIIYMIGAPYEPQTDQPAILRQSEIIHGLRNLAQNAVDFANTTVWIEARWTTDTISIRFIDDGQGFPQNLLGRIGDPFLPRARRDGRMGYEGMGLGLFIAKTLLERSGARLQFFNADENHEPGGSDLGAIVDVSWPRASIDARLNASDAEFAPHPPVSDRTLQEG